MHSNVPNHVYEDKMNLTMNQWVSLKSRPSAFGDNKNRPGKEYVSKHCPECGLKGQHKMSCDTAFQASVEKNNDLLEKLADEPKREG
jgi:hypothetical protein